jgi:hypothetical protein
LAILVVWPFGMLADDDIHTHRFCAYGHLYVEFEHNHKVWGTTFLNNQGKPIPCEENDVQETVNLKEII